MTGPCKNYRSSRPGRKGNKRTQQNRCSCSGISCAPRCISCWVAAISRQAPAVGVLTRFRHYDGSPNVGSLWSSRKVLPLGVDPAKSLVLGRVQVQNESAVLTLHVGAAIFYRMHSIASFTDSVKLPPEARQMGCLAALAPRTKSEPRPVNRIHEDPRDQQHEPACGKIAKSQSQLIRRSLDESRRAEQFDDWLAPMQIPEGRSRERSHAGHVMKSTCRYVGSAQGVKVKFEIPSWHRTTPQVDKLT